MNVYIVVAFNENNFYPISVCDNLAIAKNYANLEFKERAKSHKIFVYKKTMNAPQLLEDEIVYKL